jgi:hypothetical protein
MSFKTDMTIKTLGPSSVPPIGVIRAVCSSKASIPDYLITPARQTVVDRLYSSSIGNKRLVPKAGPVRTTTEGSRQLKAPTPKLNRSPSKDDIKVNASTHRKVMARKESVDDIDLKPSTSKASNKLPGLRQSQTVEPKKRLLRRMASTDDSEIGLVTSKQQQADEDVATALARDSPSPTLSTPQSPCKKIKKIDTARMTIITTGCGSPVSVTAKTPTASTVAAGFPGRLSEDSPSSLVRRLNEAKAAAALTKLDKQSKRRLLRKQSTDDFDVVYSGTSTLAPGPATNKEELSMILPDAASVFATEMPRLLRKDSKLFFRGHVSAKLEVHYHSATDCFEVCCFDCDKRKELERVYLPGELLLEISQQAAEKAGGNWRDRDEHAEAATYILARIETEVVLTTPPQTQTDTDTESGEDWPSPSKTTRLRLQRYNGARSVVNRLVA